MEAIFFSLLSHKERERAFDLKRRARNGRSLGTCPFCGHWLIFSPFFFGSNKCPADKKCACGVRVWIMSARDQKKMSFHFQRSMGLEMFVSSQPPERAGGGPILILFSFFYFHRFTSSSIFRMGCIGLRWVQLVSWDLRLAENGLYWVRIGFDGFGALVFG